MSYKIRYRSGRNQQEAVSNIHILNHSPEKILKIFFLILFLSMAEFKGFAQTNVTPADTLKKEQILKDKKNKEEELQEKNQKNSGIKQVKGARPDMSKSRGARPTYIERQPGSGIPRGIGRPGGAIKPGKR